MQLLAKLNFFISLDDVEWLLADKMICYSKEILKMGVITFIFL